MLRGCSCYCCTLVLRDSRCQQLCCQRIHHRNRNTGKLAGQTRPRARRAEVASSRSKRTLRRANDGNHEFVTRNNSEARGLREATWRHEVHGRRRGRKEEKTRAASAVQQTRQQLAQSLRPLSGASGQVQSAPERGITDRMKRKDGRHSQHRTGAERREAKREQEHRIQTPQPFETWIVGVENMSWLRETPEV